jgi:hypothetical protein
VKSAPSAPATPVAPVVVQTSDDGIELGSVALGAGGAALVLLAAAAGVLAVRRGGLHHGMP